MLAACCQVTDAERRTTMDSTNEKYSAAATATATLTTAQQPEVAALQAQHKRRRIDEFDIARGFAIIAVVVGHLNGIGLPIKLVDFCFSFHMPLFFIVSGYFMKPDVRLDDAYVRKNARSLLVPYLLTSLFVVILGPLESLASGQPVGEAARRMATLALAALYGSGDNLNGMPDMVIAIGALWFLLALFWARIFLAAANMTRCPGAIVLVLFIASYMMDGDLLWLPFSIQAGMGATLFLYVGKKIHELCLLERGAIHPMLWLAIAVTWAYSILFGGKLYMVSGHYGDGLLDVVGSICGTMCLIVFARVLKEHARPIAEPLRRLGTITLPVFCMHLVELDVFPWGYAIIRIDALGLPVPMWVCLLVAHFALIAVMTAVLWCLPRPISGVFFPSRRRRKAPLGAHDAAVR